MRTRARRRNNWATASYQYTYMLHAHHGIETAQMFPALARERGNNFRITRADYEQVAGPEGGLFVGSPQQIIDKLLYQHELFGHQRYLGQLDIGGMPFAKVAEMIELLASEVAPAVRQA